MLKFSNALVRILNFHHVKTTYFTQFSIFLGLHPPKSGSATLTVVGIKYFLIISQLHKKWCGFFIVEDAKNTPLAPHHHHHLILPLWFLPPFLVEIQRGWTERRGGRLGWAYGNVNTFLICFRYVKSDPQTNPAAPQYIRIHGKGLKVMYMERGQSMQAPLD